MLLVRLFVSFLASFDTYRAPVAMHRTVHAVLVVNVYILQLDEMRHIWVWMVVSMFFYGIFGVGTLFLTDFYWIQLFANLVTLFAWFGIAILPTFWVLHKVGLNQLTVKKISKTRQLEILRALENEKPSHVNIGIGDLTSGSCSTTVDNDANISKLHKMSNSQTQSSSDSHEEDLMFLSKILANYDGYSAFCFALSKEFCTECLTSFTEFIQFKQYLLRTFPILAKKLSMTQKLETKKEQKSDSQNDNMNCTEPNVAVESYVFFVCFALICLCLFVVIRGLHVCQAIFYCFFYTLDSCVRSDTSILAYNGSK